MAEIVAKKGNVTFKTDSTISSLSSGNLELNLPRLLQQDDTNLDGRVELKEYLGRKTLSLSQLKSRTAQFRYFDIDGDGAITPLDDVTGDGKLNLRDRNKFYDPLNKSLPYASGGPSNIITVNSAYAREEIYKRHKMRAVKSFEPFPEVETILPKHELVNVRVPARAVSKVYSYDIPINNLDPKLEGLTILHLADLHFNAKRDPGRFSEFRSLISKLPKKPDLIVLTGDIIENTVKDLDAVAKELLGNALPNVPKFAVLGNHDFYALSKDGVILRRSKPQGDLTAQQVQQELQSVGYTVLRNETTKVMFNGVPINFTGVDDFSMKNHVGPTAPVADSKELSFYLTHNLDTLNAAVPKNYDLVLSGHTHSAEADLIVYSGIDWITRGKDYINLNEQVRGIKALTWRTTSYVSPGFARRLGVRIGPDVENSGITLLTLRNYAE